MTLEPDVSGFVFGVFCGALILVVIILIVGAQSEKVFVEGMHFQTSIESIDKNECWMFISDPTAESNFCSGAVGGEALKVCREAIAKKKWSCYCETKKC